MRPCVEDRLCLALSLGATWRERTLRSQSVPPLVRENVERAYDWWCLFVTGCCSIYQLSRNIINHYFFFILFRNVQLLVVHCLLFILFFIFYSFLYDGCGNTVFVVFLVYTMFTDCAGSEFFFLFLSN